MISNIYFSEEYSVDELCGYYYRYITIEGIRITTNLSYYEYTESFNLSCCISTPGLDPDINLESTYRVIGLWLNTKEATDSFFESTLRIMYFKSIFSNERNDC